MLDAYIIDAIRQEEEARKRAAEEGRRIWLDLPPVPPPRSEERSPDAPDTDEDRGPIIIPLYPNGNGEEEDAA